MTTREQIFEQIATLNSEDYSTWELTDGVQITFEDFVEFGEDGEEIYREYADAAAVNSFIAYLAQHAESYTELYGLYPLYSFGDYSVRLSYSSYDI